MIQYKQCHGSIDNEDASNPLIEYKEQCEKFEQGLGSVLKSAWNHVEAVQTTDLNALIDHIADVLMCPFKNSIILRIITTNDDLYKRQEGNIIIIVVIIIIIIIITINIVLVFYYLNSIMKAADNLGEHRIMPCIRQRKVFMLCINMMGLIYSKVLAIHVLKIIEALSLLVETEDYR